MLEAVKAIQKPGNLKSIRKYYQEYVIIQNSIRKLNEIVNQPQKVGIKCANVCW